LSSQTWIYIRCFLTILSTNLDLVKAMTEINMNDNKTKTYFNFKTHLKHKKTTVTYYLKLAT
jgi:hypothetical protein